LSEEIIRRADLRVTIPMAAGTESLNVAAAAAICLYESFSRSAG
jgi:TrmH family RNA methyltransferase